MYLTQCSLFTPEKRHSQNPKSQEPKKRMNYFLTSALLISLAAGAVSSVVVLLLYYYILPSFRSVHQDRNSHRVAFFSLYQPVLHSQINVDGSSGDWSQCHSSNTVPLYNGGGGDAVVATACMNVECGTDRLCVLVMAEEGNTVSTSPCDGSIRLEMRNGEETWTWLSNLISKKAVDKLPRRKRKQPATLVSKTSRNGGTARLSSLQVYEQTPRKTKGVTLVSWIVTNGTREVGNSKPGSWIVRSLEIYLTASSEL